MKSIAVILYTLISTMSVLAAPPPPPNVSTMTVMVVPLLPPNVSVKPASVPVQPVFECLCSGKSTPFLGDFCVCGECPKVRSGFKEYQDFCPNSKFAEFNQGIDANCQGIENTEDCEYFKKSDGQLTDAYKKCRDILDSTADDCEDCKEGCTNPKEEYAKKLEDEAGAAKEKEEKDKDTADD